MGNRASKSIYGTNQVGSEVTNGVDLVDNSTKAGFSGPGRDGSVGYAYTSPTGSNKAIIGPGINELCVILSVVNLIFYII